MGSKISLLYYRCPYCHQTTVDSATHMMVCWTFCMLESEFEWPPEKYLQCFRQNEVKTWVETFSARDFAIALRRQYTQDLARLAELLQLRPLPVPEVQPNIVPHPEKKKKKRKNKKSKKQVEAANNQDEESKESMIQPSIQASAWIHSPGSTLQIEKALIEKLTEVPSPPLPKLNTQQALSDLPEDFVCKICLEIVQSPVQCAECSNLTCSDCHKAWAAKSTVCFICREQHHLARVHRMVREALETLKIQCELCKQEMVNRDYPNHACPMTPCPLNCSPEYQKRTDLPAHLAEVCPNIEVVCAECTQTGPRKEMKHHDCN